MKKTEWSSHIAFILASIGSAIGLGNIWRFSYVMGQNGGGSFLALYLLSILLVGVPLLILMLSVGRYFKKTITPLFKASIKHGSFSFFHHFLNLVVLSYYTVVASWVLIFLMYSLFFHLPDFDKVLDSPLPLLFTPIIFSMAYIVMKSDIREGLEKINNIGMPLFFAILLFLFFFSFTLSGSSHAIQYMLSFSEINWKSLVLVISQTLFSLSVGYGGIMLTYGSYLDPEENIPRSSLVIGFSDTLVSLLSAFIIFTICFTFSIPPSSGPTLAFKTIPEAFSLLPFGNILMILFFSLLFIAAFTSIISMYEVEVSDLEYIFKVDRQRASLYLLFFLIFLSLPSIFSYSFFKLKLFEMPILDFLDSVVVGRLAPICALLTLVMLTWVWKKYSSLKLWWPLSFYLKYILPLILGIATLLNLIL